VPDWTRGMQQTFEYYEVDPDSWLDIRRLDHVLSSTVTREESSDTLGNATIESTDEFDEIYVRIYLKTIQDGIEEKESLGTFLIQTPYDNYNGRVHTFSYDAYTPLLELKDSMPPIGYYVAKGVNIMDQVYRIFFDVYRPPVIAGRSSETLENDFIANSDDNWLTFLSDLIANAGFVFGLDELSRLIFVPTQDVNAMQPIWEFNDDNSSILYPDIKMERDLYGIPNVVEVVYTKNQDASVSVRVVNDDPGSPTSTASRGREIVFRETNPTFNGTPSMIEITQYAKDLLRNKSTLEYKLQYKHGYCPVRVGDCVLLNYRRANLINVKAKVVSQSITCEPGCPVEETAVYTKNLWG